MNLRVEGSHPVIRIVGIGFVFLIATVAWMVLGALMLHRTDQSSSKLRDSVAELWGSPQIQKSPRFTLVWNVTREEQRKEVIGNLERLVTVTVTEAQSRELSPNSSRIEAALGLDQRLKGLMWYSLYNLDFAGTWTLEHQGAETGTLQTCFPFADPQALYDNFQFKVNGQDLAKNLRPSNGFVCHDLPVAPGDKLQLSVGYRTRGMDSWRYSPGDGVSNLENFQLKMTTDFRDIDFPPQTMSPSSRLESGEGWQLDWKFQQMVTGQQMGMVMPQRIQPGQLASELSWTAPISLFFFFLVLYVLSLLRGLDIHPINYLFLAGAFVSFHLLFGYTVDHLRIEQAFVLSSAVSLALVVSYLRLVVSARFAFLEAAGAQLVYLIGFSLAHFFDGFTGLTVTVLSVLTLFLLMQWTGRVSWSRVLSKSPAPPSGI